MLKEQMYVQKKHHFMSLYPTLSHLLLVFIIYFSSYSLVNIFFLIKIVLECVQRKSISGNTLRHQTSAPWEPMKFLWTVLVRCKLWGGSQFHTSDIFHRGNILLYKVPVNQQNNLIITIVSIYYVGYPLLTQILELVSIVVVSISEGNRF